MIVLAGVRQPVQEPWEPFAPLVMEFLGQLSREIRRERQQYEEMAAFGFWCRRAHLEEFKKRYEDGRVRLGRGVIFHIAASNVPVLFAYSLAMGLMAGDSCCVRISSGSQEQDRAMCGVIGEVLGRPGYEDMRKRISVFSCGRDSPAIAGLLGDCAGCVVWGGDRTVREIRAMPMRADAVQLMFPDRYSICILDTDHMERMTDEELQNLAHRFCNDTYALDQNACSSPGLVVWNQRKESEKAECVRARWWETVARGARTYRLTAHKATAKYEQMCRYAMTSSEPVKIMLRGNRLGTIELPHIPEHPDQLRGRFGMFFEYLGDWREAVGRLASGSLQTITFHGVNEQELVDYVVKNHLPGVHRIVPAGRAADMDLIWDGQDFITVLSRQIGREA